MIYKDKCLELGLPEPQSYQNQEAYVLMSISLGYKIHTYAARYIGIANLHSVVSKLKRKGHNFTHEKKRAYCPQNKIVPPHSVVNVSMSSEQILFYKAKKSRQES
ncbi:hypothetical protein [uncultured Pseudoalteromonas sp.]|uniref:hypothetical protein n=1 Tax=uncultured Pseudoalteromonas sp. TaxID=114053 RepID=UPI002591629F|nr:hypothetical protein [uncultured Pseudoalteromonas sp.]